MKTENKVRTAFKRAMVAGTAAMVPVVSFAQSADPTGEIKTKIETYAGYAVGVVIAFALAVWGLRAAGLIGRKG